MYRAFVYLEPLMHAGSAPSVALSVLAELPTTNAPNAAPHDDEQLDRLVHGAEVAAAEGEAAEDRRGDDDVPNDD